jgi:hypothetical protein
MGETWHTSESVKKACDFLIGKQNSDGGWGEHWSSCEVWEYVQHEKSQVVNTSWAVLALMHARYPDKRPIERGLEVRHTIILAYSFLNCLLQLIKSRQQPTGEWTQEDMEGLFNCTRCAIFTGRRVFGSVYEKAALLLPTQITNTTSLSGLWNDTLISTSHRRIPWIEGLINAPTDLQITGS